MSTPQNEPLKKKSNIWRSGNGPNSVFIDMSGRKEGRAEFLRLVAEQYPSRVGVLLQQAGNLRFAEISFDEEDIQVTTFIEKGLCFDDETIILPCRALEPHMDILSVRLSKLPLLNETKLLSGLKDSLSPFGQILDVGLLLEPEHKTFMGNGFAILDISKKNGDLSPLTHVIPWKNNKEQAFHAVWSKMPKYCKYCHENGHAVADCPTRQRRFSCWNCEETGHLAKNCPRRSAPTKKAKGLVIPPKPFHFEFPKDDTPSSTVLKTHPMKRKRAHEGGVGSQMVRPQFAESTTKDTSSTSHRPTQADSMSTLLKSNDAPPLQDLPDTQESIRPSQLDSQIAAICDSVSREQFDINADTDMNDIGRERKQDSMDIYLDSSTGNPPSPSSDGQGQSFSNQQ